MGYDIEQFRSQIPPLAYLQEEWSLNTIEQETGNILFTGGRAPATLELVRIFHRKGFKVFIAESFKSHICKFSSCVHKSFTLPYPNKNTEEYIGQLIKIIHTERIDILIQ